MLQCYITGRLTADAEIKTINEKDYYKLRAVHNEGKDKPGTFVNVLYRKYGTTDLTRYFRKGAIISASGRLTVSGYAGQDGKARADITVWTDNVQIEQFAPEEEGGLLD